MRSLLLVSHDNQHLDPQTARALSAALALGQSVDLLVVGTDCGGVATAAAGLGGIDRVLVADGHGLAHQPAEAIAAAFLSVITGYSAVLSAATSVGKSALPRVAARLDVMQLSEIVAVLAHNRFRRPIYAGNALETVETDEPVRVITVRAAAFEEAPGGGSASIEAIAAPAPDPRVRLVSGDAPADGRRDLGSARTVVSGGRGFGSKANFDALLSPLAEALDAAIGASRAAVDAGYAASELQVGQTGRIVAPRLYIACGISGAIQHLAGMKDSGTIVAINTDPDAPIFGIADFGLVADLFEALPELTAAIRTRKG